MRSSKILYHILAFLVVAVWGVTFISSKVLLMAGLTPAWIFAIRFVISYIGIWAICLTRPGALRLWSRSVRDELIYLFLGVVASLACFVVWNKVMARLGNVTSTNYIYLNPFFTLVAAMVFLGERLTPLSAAGSAAIFLGIYLAGKNNASDRR